MWSGSSSVLNTYRPGSSSDQRKNTSDRVQTASTYSKSFYGNNSTMFKNNCASLPNQQTCIKNLKPGMPNVKVVGTIITKDGPKSIISKKNPGTERFLLSFILRDSPNDTISISCWGSEVFIKEMSPVIQIGDVVEISNPQVQTKTMNSGDERFRPATSSLLQLNISEQSSSIKQYDSWDLASFAELQNIPTKANNDFLTFEDINNRGQAIAGELVNILGAVKKIGQVKDILTKTGKQTRRCEIQLFDETCRHFSMVFWDDGWINLAKSWTPFDTVLFVADILLKYDSFRSCMTATAVSKTVVTANPDTLEGHGLYEYAQACALEYGALSEIDMDEQSDPDLHTITDMFTIEEIKQKRSDILNEGKSIVYGCTFAFISKLDIDEESVDFITYHCSKCKRILRDTDAYMCSNDDCITSVIAFDNYTVKDTEDKYAEYDISLSLSDHTGTIPNCQISGAAADSFIGRKAGEYLDLDVSVKTSIKWKYLLERFQIYFKLMKISAQGTVKTKLKMLACCPIDSNKLYKYLQTLVRV